MRQLFNQSYIVLLFCWLVSIAIQLPNLNRPLSKHHEFNMAMIMTVVNSWQIKGGNFPYHLTPVINYGNEGDQYFGEDSLVINQKYYYPSFGPMQFIIPFIMYKILHIPVNPLSVQIVGLLVQLLVVLLIYNISFFLFYSHNHVNRVALLSGIMFLFLPSSLWYYSNGYAHESLASLFYSYIFYYVLLASKKVNNIKSFHNILLFFTIFFGVLTDWYVSVVVSTSGLLLIYYYVKTRKKELVFAIILGIAAIIMGILVLYFAYSTELGFERLKNNFAYKFTLRTGQSLFSIYGLKTITTHFSTMFGIGLCFLLGIVFINIKKIKRESRIAFTYLLVTPIVYTLFFSNYSMEHEYAMVKFTIPIVLLIVYFILKFANEGSWKYLLGAICIVNVLQYYWINKPQLNQELQKMYALEMSVGHKIKEQTKPEQYLTSDLIHKNNLAIMYYAQRNIRYVQNEQEAIQYKLKSNLQNVFFVTLIKDSIIIKKL